MREGSTIEIENVKRGTAISLMRSYPSSDDKSAVSSDSFIRGQKSVGPGRSPGNPRSARQSGGGRDEINGGVDRSDAFVPGAIREPGSNLLVNREIVEPGFDSVAADKACDKDDAEQRRVSLPLSQPPLRLDREPRSSELKGGILL